MRLKSTALCLLVLAACGACQAKTALVQFAAPRAFRSFSYSHAKWDAKAGGITFDEKTPAKAGEDAKIAVVESPEVKSSIPFDRAIASWNATTPKGAYLTVFLKARVGGEWTKWYKMGLWNTDDKPMHKTSFGKQGDSFGGTETEVLALKNKADAIKFRVQLESTDGKTYPTVRFLSAILNDTTVTKEDTPIVKSAWGKDLDVPCLSQLSVTGGWAWCSPTSTAMVLGYWGQKLKRTDMTVGITDAANAMFDQDWGGTGNWSFNVAYAGEFKGMRAYVTRFTSVSDIESLISKGVPLVVALDYGILTKQKFNSGHLMVIRGFTAEGDPIFNDPWTDLKKNENVRKIFKRADLEAAWLGPKGSWGTAYVIYPEGYKL